jgi:hypothetical protein
MEPTHAKNQVRQSKAANALDDRVDDAEVALRERVEQARDLVEDLRDRAEVAFHERPYLLPVATGALGFGVGLLVGSKLTRILLITAAGALLSDRVRSQVIRVGRDLLSDIGARVEEEGVEDEVEPAV